ncbi:MarR family winged helix-turn-helix transcriptional regulator [Roseovarius salinarum]|uniref:MarR family winged helix-turn-helix transcriptional regulator n=1 Tax=Roseovarius salinarum TaxID=1981892 RepID=UPI000C334F00|nr:MarR family transcriptional regulator [Roseovarius salinarum]
MKRAQFDLATFFPYRLAVLSERTSKCLSDVYRARFGLSMPEWRVIVHLARCQPVSVREIHNCVNMEKPKVSRAVARLETTGLVRKDADSEDQRLVRISLTQRGETVLDELIPLVRAFEARILGDLEPGELDRFLATMERIRAALDRESADTAASGAGEEVA